MENNGISSQDLLGKIKELVARQPEHKTPCVRLDTLLLITRLPHDTIKPVLEELHNDRLIILSPRSSQKKTKSGAVTITLLQF